MTRLDQESSARARRIAVAGAAVAACCLATSLLAVAQDQSAATAKDVIWARKTLMNSIMDRMDKIAVMISLGKIDLPATRSHADTMSAMFVAFPHLFPPSSNLWKENADLEPVTDTIASPEIWTNYPDFYQRAAAAAKTARDMSRADSEDEIKRLNRALGIACDTCHALYLKEQ